MFLGVDGGGSKSAFLLADTDGRVLAAHAEGSLYHGEIGLDGVAATLARGVAAVLARAGVTRERLAGAWVGLPAFGEDRVVQSRLEALPAAALPGVRTGCGNDMRCAWAGSLAGADGINVIAGTGSMAFGVFEGREARTGGWGEVFGDEGSAFWIAREGLALFSRMSDGRAPRGPLHALLRERLALDEDLDLCGRALADARSGLASHARLVHEAAEAGDAQAHAILERAAAELAAMVVAARRALRVPADLPLKISTSGGVLAPGGRTRAMLQAALAATGDTWDLREPRMSPAAGAAWLAAREAGTPLSSTAVDRLAEGAR